MKKQEQKNTVLIAVYGTLRTGEANQHYVKDAASVRNCTIKGTLYNTGWGFPALVLNGSTAVAGELVEITLEAWRKVDRLEGYPGFYDRLLTTVKLEDGSTAEAWVYVMNKLPPKATVIGGGDWKKR